MSTQAVGFDLSKLTLADVRDILIRTYVPEAEQLTWDQAFQLATERDQVAAKQMADDYTQLKLEEAAGKARMMDQEAVFDQHFVDMCL